MKKEFKRKLLLKKKTIAKLNVKDLKNVNAGIDTTINPPPDANNANGDIPCTFALICGQ